MSLWLDSGSPRELVNIISGCVCEGVSERLAWESVDSLISTRVSRRSKEEPCLQSISINWFLEGRKNGKAEEEWICSPWLSYDIHLLLLSDTGTPCSAAFGLGPELTPLATLFSDFWVSMQMTTLDFPGLSLQTADRRPSQSPDSCEPVPTTHFFPYVTIYPTGYIISETNTLTSKNYGETVLYNWTMKRLVFYILHILKCSN